jgi:putative ABC transport system permease protein
VEHDSGNVVETNLMKDTNRISPPRWAQRLLEWYCRPELLEDLQGDLNEYFNRHYKSKGPFRAKLIYAADVFKFIRSYTIRKPNFLNVLIQWIMLSSYIKTSGRSIVRNKLFSTINIIGLAMSMSVGLIVIAMINDAFQYDKFHENRDRIYRLISWYEFNGRRDEGFYATTSLNASRNVKESVSNVEDVAIFHRNFSGDTQAGEKKIPLQGYWSNEGFFKVFSFTLLQGNPATALRDPFSIVLTEKSALKLFGEVNAIGKSVRLNDRDYAVTGVLQDLPKFSHLQFDMLGSLSTREITEKDNPRELAWDNMWGSWTYLLLKDGTKPEDLKTGLDALSTQQNKTVAKTRIELALQPLNEIVVGENLSNAIGPTLGKTTIWILSVLTIIVILSAALNYTNLSIARSFSRSREVGIRKTIGAQRSHVTFQFITESIVISLFALVISFVLFIIIRPHFIGLEHTLQDLLVMDLTPQLVLYFILFAIVIGVLAGIVPALFFGRINAIKALKNVSASAVLKGLTFRKGLVVFQSCISIIAITTTLVFYKQYKHFVSYDLGFTTENILNIALQGNKTEALKKSLSELPEVKGISQSQMITSIGDYWGVKMKNPSDPTDSMFVNYTTVDEFYIPLHDHQLIAGRNFNPSADNSTESEVIVNEKVLKRFRIANGNPAQAIDEIVSIDNKNLRIVGVIKDFHYGRANSNHGKEVVLRHSNVKAEFLNVKIQSSDWLETRAKIESIWKSIDPVHSFSARFYDEQIEEAFAGLKASMKVGGFLATLVISISSIGLLGMVVFTTETKLKEISIRKVHGASESGLVLRLSRGFLLLLLIAGGIALPVTYFFFEGYLLPQIENHIPIQMPEMIIGYFSVVAVAMLMIGSQTIKVARTNPATTLKAE